jgi:predicted RNase H-like nuclease (RuvC/YqgF family)
MNEEERKAAEAKAKADADAAAAATKTPPTVEELQKRLADLESENAKVKSEAATYRLEKKELKDQLTALDNEKTEAEKARLVEAGKHEEARKLAEKQLADYKTKYELDKKMMLVEKVATEQGIIDPMAVSLIKLDKITINDQGEVQGVAEALAELKTKAPNLFKAPVAAGADAAAAAAANPNPVSTGSAAQNPAPGTPGASSVAALNAIDYAAAKEKMING